MFLLHKSNTRRGLAGPRRQPRSLDGGIAPGIRRLFRLHGEALRGWKVGLVEKEDFAFGTSSRSSKIIHGGVRYLEYGHFLLVRESAQERAVLRDIAPHLVHTLPFVFPVFDSESLMKIRPARGCSTVWLEWKTPRNTKTCLRRRDANNFQGFAILSRVRCATRSTSRMTHSSRSRTRSPPPSTARWWSTMRVPRTFG
ncbi:MAG TPA: FAD-dependent oxidoreductase [Gemmatimonadetes bacterium]|nr:FAD-dependent oxidoreductase [Gemmatimonadota bacterium]